MLASRFSDLLDWSSTIGALPVLDGSSLSAFDEDFVLLSSIELDFLKSVTVDFLLSRTEIELLLSKTEIDFLRSRTDLVLVLSGTELVLELDSDFPLFEEDDRLFEVTPDLFSRSFDREWCFPVFSVLSVLSVLYVLSVL
jgi:hypothetical protein